MEHTRCSASSRAFDELRAHRLYAEVVADNVASRRLCERAGFVVEGVSRDGFAPTTGRFAICARTGCSRTSDGHEVPRPVGRGRHGAPCTGNWLVVVSTHNRPVSSPRGPVSVASSTT
ncbi:MAG: GNAT family protein [Vulcanimicrobiaceae bacterium]